MSYGRVIPRDLFNESSLLKCYGRLWIILNDEVSGHSAVLDFAKGADGNAFNIRQDPSSGSLTIDNVAFTINGVRWNLMRPLNSREEWPLWCVDDTYETEIAVFAEDGHLSVDFLGLIKPEH